MPQSTMQLGTVCWLEHGTTDLAKAKKFYADLFGWGYAENDMGGGMLYNMFPSAEHATGGMYELMEQHKAMNVPPHWLTYFLVESAVKSAEKLVALGGKVVVGPMEVPGIGHMVIATDTNGATFAMWQPANPGASKGLPTGHGSFGWAQLNVGDTSKAPNFYKGLLGWEAKVDPIPDGAGGSGMYTTWMAGESMAGGMMAMPPGDKMPSHWLVYFNVDDVDATAKKVAAGGGTVMVPPMDVPGMLRFSVFADPNGAIFAVMKTFMPA